MSDTPEFRSRPTSPYSAAEAALESLLDAYVVRFGHDSHERTDGSSQLRFGLAEQPVIPLETLPGVVMELAHIGRIRADEMRGTAPNRHNAHFVDFFGSLKRGDTYVRLTPEGEEVTDVVGARYDLLVAPEYPPVLVAETDIENGADGSSTLDSDAWQSAYKIPVRHEDVFAAAQTARDAVDLMVEHEQP